MALDTFNSYLFVSAGEQSNKYLTPTYAGGVAKFQTQRAQALSKLLVQIDPVQDLNGQANPYPPGGGKNKLENTAQTATQSGVTFTVNEDGTVSTSGTSTEDANYIVLGVMTLPAGDYILSGCPSGGSASSFYIRINRGSTASGAAGVRVATDIGSGAAFTLTEATEICVWMACDNGQVMNNKVFKPMIRLASVTDSTYAPYSNICPITGRTGMTVTRVGKNLCGELYQGYWAFADGGAVTSGTWVKTPKIRCKGSTTYTASSDYESHWMGFLFYDQNGAFISTDNRTGQTKKYTATSPANAAYMAVNINAVTSTTGVTPEEVTSFQLEESATQTAYEPYTATDYPITWQTQAGTIYGGTLDVVSGVLTVTHAGIRLTSDNQSWSAAGSVSAGTAQYYCTLNPAADASAREIMCSHARNVSGNSSPWGTCFLYNGVFAMKNGDGGAGFSSLNDFKAWLDVNNLQVCYKLATPQTYQLDPEDVMTLAGFNQVYSDAGPVIDIKF